MLFSRFKSKDPGGLPESFNSSLSLWERVEYAFPAKWEFRQAKKLPGSRAPKKMNPRRASSPTRSGAKPAAKHSRCRGQERQVHLL